MPKTITKEKVKIEKVEKTKSTVRPSFVQLSRTDVGRTNLKKSKFEEQISIGRFDTKATGWLGEEITLRWYPEEGLSYTFRFDKTDSLDDKEFIPEEIRSLIKQGEVTPKEICDVLLANEFESITTYI